MTITVLMDGYGTRPDPLTLSSHTASVARRLRFRTPAKLYVYNMYNTLLQRLASDLEHVAAALGERIQEGDAVIGRPDLVGGAQVTAADQSRLRIVWRRACLYGSPCQRGRKRVATTCSYGTGAVRRPSAWAKPFTAPTVGSVMAGS